MVLRVPIAYQFAQVVCKFQYPLVDRVGFEGYELPAIPALPAGFSILWWIELVLRGGW